MSGDGFAGLARGVAELAVGYFGGGWSVTLRRRASLLSAVTGERVVALTVKADTPAASPSVVLVADGLRGRVPAGCGLAIVGDVTEYVVTAEAVATVAGEVTLALSPALVAEALEDTVATLSPAYVERSVPVLLADVLETEEGAGLEGSRRVYHVPGDTGWAPLEGDVLEDGGRPFVVQEVRTVSPAGSGGVVRWALVVVGGVR